MRPFLRAAAILVLLAGASSGLAELSKSLADFPKGPAQYLLTKEERKQWEAIRTDEQAEAFIALFWAKRDPTPATPLNEFRAGVEGRIRTADSRFGSGKSVGSVTDRGKVFILMGSPTRIRRSGNPGGGNIQTPVAAGGATGVQNYGIKELWEYDQAKIDYTQLGQPIAEIAFVDTYGANEFLIERVPKTDFTALFDRVARGYITQPALTAAPVYAEAASPAPAAPAAGLAAFRTDALRMAVDEARAAKATGNEMLFVDWGEFVTADGAHFVPIQLFVPATAGLTATTPVTFFGRVDREEGGEVTAIFEEPVTLTASKDALVYARSLTLAPGGYRGTFGLAVDGKAVAVVSKEMNVQGIDPAAAAVSNLMLSNNVYALSEAQDPTDPYAFGGLRVIPQGNLVFKRSDELWYFIEARNPGVDATTGQPNMTMRVTVTGETAEGRPVKMLGPSEAVQAIPMKGVAGHFAIGQALPLESFKPGKYTITLQVKDAALDRTYELKESFRISG